MNTQSDEDIWFEEDHLYHVADYVANHEPEFVKKCPGGCCDWYRCGKCGLHFHVHTVQEQQGTPIKEMRKTLYEHLGNI